MRLAHPLGLSADGALLVIETTDGEQLGVPADERLRAALRRDRPRLGQLEIEMDSALRPSEIQARIRSGQSLDEVARAAGVPAEKVEPFAAPVIAERQHIAGVALGSSVRRRGETHAHRTLRQVVSERLLSRGIDADSVEWDAWRNEDRRWSVRAAYRSGSASREALFVFDKAGRFSTATNDDARWLISEPSPATGPQPGRPGHSRYDDSDELALVRAVSDNAPSDEDPSDHDSTGEGGDAPEGNSVAPSRPTDESPSDDGASSEQPAASAATPQAIGEEVEAELDASDVIPEGQSELDVLYDMLGGISEDSINIYAGLDRPVVDEGESPATGGPPASASEHTGGPASEPTDAPPVSASEPTDGPPVSASEPTDGPPASASETADDVPASPSEARSEPTEPAPADPEQPSLVDEAEPQLETPKPTEPAPRPSRRAPRKKGRASVPSWDEIMFGGPQEKK